VVLPRGGRDYGSNVNYQEALAELDRHINHEATAAVAGRIEGLRLDRMRALMHALGDPQRSYPVIQVTGTNGKGSTARMITELLAAHGLVVGLYASPHLQRVNERLWWSGEPRQRVDHDGEVFTEAMTTGRQTLPVDRDQLIADEDLVGLDDEEVMSRLSEEVHRRTVDVPDRHPGGPIDDESFAAIIAEVIDLAEVAGVDPTYFELLTAAAFTWFAQLPVDVAVVEVGLLGRFDATNVADAHVAVITNIGEDHTDFTGDWRADIAREKAGIVKRIRPDGGEATTEQRPTAESGMVDSFLVLGESDADLAEIFEAVAGSQRWVRGEEFAVETNTMAVGGRLVDVRTPAGVLDELFVPVHGEHQGENAALAIAAVEAFFARPLDPEVARAGLWQVRLPGRFEVVDRSPLLVVDGAHNPDGAATVAETLAEDFTVTGKVVLVVGVLAGRDVERFLDALGARSADLVIACTPPSPRARPASEVAAAARALGAPVEVVTDIGDAIDRARAVTTGEDAIVVTGSIHLVGAVRDKLGLDPV
jgi:dihydrofolate synthase / folylpolyglutamate synthase